MFINDLGLEIRKAQRKLYIIAPPKSRKKNKSLRYQIMNLMIPSTGYKDNFILFLSAVQPDCLHNEHTRHEHMQKTKGNLKLLKDLGWQVTSVNPGNTFSLTSSKILYTELFMFLNGN